MDLVNGQKGKGGTGGILEKLIMLKTQAVAAADVPKEKTASVSLPASPDTTQQQQELLLAAARSAVARSAAVAAVLNNNHHTDLLKPGGGRQTMPMFSNIPMPKGKGDENGKGNPPGHGTSAGFCNICHKFVSNRTNHKYVHSQVNNSFEVNFKFKYFSKPTFFCGKWQINATSSPADKKYGSTLPTN